MNYYAALDVSLRSVHLCVVDDKGKLTAETKLSSEVTDIIAYLDDLDLELSVVGLEAGTLAQYLTYGLQSAGFEVVCMEARQVKAALSAMRNKTDKNDARGIAQLLRTGWYSKVHISRCGDRDVRCILYTAANALLTRSSKWSPLKAWGMKLVKTRGHRRAVIAVARKLAVILHRMWLDDVPFRWSTEAARS